MTFSIFLNDGAGHLLFSGTTAALTEAPGDFVVVDLNHDGLLDIVVFTVPGTIEVLNGTSETTFGAPTAILHHSDTGVSGYHALEVGLLGPTGPRAEDTHSWARETFDLPSPAEDAITLVTFSATGTFGERASIRASGRHNDYSPDDHGPGRRRNSRYARVRLHAGTRQRHI